MFTCLIFQNKYLVCISSEHFYLSSTVYCTIPVIEQRNSTVRWNMQMSELHAPLGQFQIQWNVTPLFHLYIYSCCASQHFLPQILLLFEISAHNQVFFFNCFKFFLLFIPFHTFCYIEIYLSTLYIYIFIPHICFIYILLKYWKRLRGPTQMPTQL